MVGILHSRMSNSPMVGKIKCVKSPCKPQVHHGDSTWLSSQNLCFHVYIFYVNLLSNSHVSPSTRGNLICMLQGHIQTFIWVGSFRKTVDFFLRPFLYGLNYAWCVRMLKPGGSGGMPPGNFLKIDTKRFNLVVFQSIKTS